MPVFHDDDLPRPKGSIFSLVEARPIVTFGATMKTTKRVSLDLRRHRKNQFILVLHGAFHCEMNGGFWTVPAQSAIWIPGDTVMHNTKVIGPCEIYGSFIAPEAASRLPSDCCALSATPLLRELMIRAATFSIDQPEGAMEAHLTALLLDEIATAPSGNFYLPMPTDRRLRRIVEMMMANPAERGTMDTWAQRAGLSKRTLARILASETGMSFGRWRQQFNILLALEWLAKGASIQQVASDLGYESASSFVTMFRKALGTSPGRYMTERHASRS